jgi:hypothetical protein
MNARLKSVPMRNLYYLASILNIGTVVAFFALRSFLPPVVPLFYGLPTGENQLAPTLGLLIAPAASAVTSIINFTISIWIEDIFLRKVLAISSIVVSALAAITVAKIIFLVGFF